MRMTAAEAAAEQHRRASQRLVATIGVPGSGKSTIGRMMPYHGWLNVSYDHTRTMLFGSKKEYHRIVASDNCGGKNEHHPAYVAMHAAYEAACARRWPPA